MANSRTKNFSVNAYFAALSELVSAMLAFASRIVFVRCLSAEYLGLGGLFANILTILSLAELGIGTAISYSMYKPLAENDVEKIKSLVNFYRKAYLTIGTAVLVIGVCLSPFLDLFIKERPNIPYNEFIAIYFLTVFQTALSYFFSFRYTIFSADQKGYILQKVTMTTSFIRTVLQIVVLLVFHNYILFLLIAIFAVIVSNIILSRKAVKAYPYLKEKSKPLASDTVRQIKRNTFAMLVYRIGIVIATTIDTLLISRYFGIVAVAIYTNYHLIISYSDKFFSHVLGTIAPSLGNLLVSAENEKKMEVFHALQLVYFWLATYLAVLLIILFNPFVELAFGKEYLFDQSMVIALVVSITLTNFQRPCGLTRDAAGLYWYGKYRPIAMSILNVLFSVTFVHLYGIIGVVIGTALAKLSTYVWYDPYIVFKHALKGKLSHYYLKYFFHWALLFSLIAVCRLISYIIPIKGVLGLLCGFVYITIVVNATLYFLYRKSESMNYLRNLILPFWTKIKR